MAKFILRVDDVGWRPEDKSNDVNLDYFRKWRDAFGIADYPVVYGVIPSTVTDRELDWFNGNLAVHEELAVHGKDHAAGAIVGWNEMQHALTRFSAVATCRSYIPPFNAADDQTISDWGSVCPGGFFFGGFNREHHNYGNLPLKTFQVWHLPAIRDLYDRVTPLTEQIAHWRDIQCPLVLTLHATWDCDRLQFLPGLLAEIKDDLVSPDYLNAWAVQTAISRAKLTAAHYLAYSWVLPHITPQDNVLDFGSRYSVLPVQMTLRGARVTVTDRDPKLEEYQREKFGDVPGPYCCLDWDGLTPPLRHDFHIVSSCWAIQHNSTEDIPVIARNLGEALRPNGKLLIVASHTPDESRWQTDRADPQWILNWDDHQRHIIGPSGCRLESHTFFQYDHATSKGGECAAQDANAVCYLLRKTVAL